MFLATCFCDFKCCREANIPITVCQNHLIARQPEVDIPIDEIFRRYTENPITKAIVFGGMEPFLQFDEMFKVIRYFRGHDCNDDIVIYTGYYHHEIEEKIMDLEQFENIIVKFGRFIPNQKAHYDDILGVNLISDNQYAERIS